MHKFSIGNFFPDITYIYDIDTETAVERAKLRESSLKHTKAEDRYERMSDTFHKNVRRGFLEMANKYKSEILASMSHEIRTPHNSLLILYKLIKDKKSKKLTEKKDKLFAELDSLLLETYQTSTVLIDDPRLVAGEEGCLLSLDLEFLKNNNREGLFDPRKMSSSVKEKITKRLEEIESVIKS